MAAHVGWRIRTSTKLMWAVGLAFTCLAAMAQPAGADEPAAIGPPFYAKSRLGHTYRSAPGPGMRSCPAMRAYYGHCRYHPYPAVDFMLPEGTPIRAVADGVVVLVGQELDGEGDPQGCDQPAPTETAYCRRPGRFVVLAHDASVGLPPLTTYKHLQGYRVAVGQEVIRGQMLGRSGRTQSPNAHLHFDAQRSLDCFNTYACQVGYGTMRWCRKGGQVGTGTSSTLLRGQVFNPRRCPA